MGNPENEFFRFVNDEESQTDFFVSLLARGETPRILNEIHDTLQFDDTAEVIATQRDGLSFDSNKNDTQRTLDWVVADNEKIVGYESKRGDDLYGKQLREERRKLQANAGNRATHLYAFTEDRQDPDVDADYQWKSWFNVGRTIIELNSDSEILSIMTDLLKNSGYEGFTGFADYERSETWFIKHQNEAADLAREASDYAQGISLYEKGTKHTNLHNRATDSITDVEEKEYRAFGPSYYVFANQPSEYFNGAEVSYNTKNLGWYIAVVVPALHNEVYVQLNTYLSKDSEAKEIFRRYSKEIADLIVRNGLEMHASYNSLLKEISPTVHTTRSEIIDILENKAGSEQYKRIRIGKPSIDTDQPPREIVRETAEQIEEIHDLFYEGVERRKEY